MECRSPKRNDIWNGIFPLGRVPIQVLAHRLRRVRLHRDAMRELEMECACDQACGQSKYGEDDDYEKDGPGARSRVLAVRHTHNLTVPEPYTVYGIAYALNWSSTKSMRSCNTVVSAGPLSGRPLSIRSCTRSPDFNSSFLGTKLPALLKVRMATGS